jgi:hypothetical protein
LIDGQGEALGAKAVEMALQGDSTMLRALLSTLVPPRRERTVEFELPKIESAADLPKASSAVMAACAAGELSPREASEFMGLILTHARVIEVAVALEKKQSPSEVQNGFVFELNTPEPPAWARRTIPGDVTEPRDDE